MKYIDYINFVKTFSPGNFEFCISNNLYGSYKILSNTLCSNYHSSENRTRKVFEYVSKYSKHQKQVEEIFHYFKEHFFHVGVDIGTSRVKFYISLYQYPFELCIQKICELKKILNIETKYFLEKDFVRFDCLGFDIGESGDISVKIYEIVSGNRGILPDFIEEHDIKEYGILKDFSGRKKMFIRFREPLDINIFSDIFQLSQINQIQREVENLYTFKKKVKYYCSEGEKQEIYLI